MRAYMEELAARSVEQGAAVVVLRSPAMASAPVRAEREEERASARGVEQRGAPGERRALGSVFSCS